MGNDLTGLLKKDVNVMKIVGMATTIESNSRNVKQKKKKFSPQLHCFIFPPQFENLLFQLSTDTNHI